MQRHYIPSPDRAVLVVLGTGMLGFVVFYSFLLSRNAGRTISVVKWSWLVGLGFVLVLSLYLWFTGVGDR